MSARLLLPDHEKSALQGAAAARFSCHTFGSRLSVSDWAALSYLAGKSELPGIRLTLLRVEESFFTGTLLSFGRITGCTAIAVLSGPNTPEAPVLGGFCASAFVLTLTQSGYASCFLTGGYSKKQLPFTPRSGEVLYALIALGHPGEKLPGARERKSLQKLCAEDPQVWESRFQQAAALVQLAPSQSNRQPVLMGAGPGRFWIDSSDKTRLDLGIAICHAELAFSGPHTWSLSNQRAEPMSLCTF
ncbi:MAG: hypothetical protein IJ229_05295 [Clostridia bacterium]|nr:hypothetical protein [Clostridia bacterium]MBR2287870.1 hypothetical protein [Clostridia bacterium]